VISARRFNEEVLYAEEDVVKVDARDIDGLVELARKNPRERVRLCAHVDVDDTLHEMLIVHARGAYVRPHKHPGKNESFHIITGTADIVVFDEWGEVSEVIPMGDYQSGRKFYYRLRPPCFHTLLIRSELLVFHETTNGPFNREDMVFADWAPEEGDHIAVSDYLEGLERDVAGALVQRGESKGA
jgi:cupin fold WbuC family metalloprotein